MSNEKVTDLSYIHESAFGNKAFVEEMINLFLNEVPGSVKSVQAAVEKEDYNALQKELHKLRPNLTAFGVTQIDKQLEEVQRAADNGNAHPNLRQILTELYDLTQKAEEELKAEMQQL